MSDETNENVVPEFVDTVINDDTVAPEPPPVNTRQALNISENQQWIADCWVNDTRLEKWIGVTVRDSEFSLEIQVASSEVRASFILTNFNEDVLEKVKVLLKSNLSDEELLPIFTKYLHLALELSGNFKITNVPEASTEELDSNDEDEVAVVPPSA